jgi:glutathione S-transferase
MRGITRSVGLLTNVCVSTRLVANISTVSTEDKLKLWHCSDARSLRCLWTLEEIGYKNYELVTMPFPPRVFHKEFLKTNPLGTIPFFEGKDGLKMTESCGSKFCLRLFVQQLVSR